MVVVTALGKMVLLLHGEEEERKLFRCSVK